MAQYIVDFPSYSMVDLSIAMLVHQRVMGIILIDNDIPIDIRDSHYSHYIPISHH